VPRVTLVTAVRLQMLVQLLPTLPMMGRMETSIAFTPATSEGLPAVARVQRVPQVTLVTAVRLPILV
jgi:hypothetical protein